MFIDKEFDFNIPIKVWGSNAQLDMVQEEAAELISSVNRWRRGRDTSVDVASEVADVIIMLQQLICMIPDGIDVVNHQYVVKMDRLKRRLEDMNE
jgi:hypothetical protein